MTRAGRPAAVAATAIRRAAQCLSIGTALLAAGCASLPPRRRVPSRGAAADAGSSLAQAPQRPAGRRAERLPPDGHRRDGAAHAAGAGAPRQPVARRAGYHIQDDETGRIFLRVLRDAAERGVRVRLLLDDLYTSGHDELLLGLAAHANVELRLFNPFPAGRDSLTQRFAASLFDFGRVHRRMHNKLLVADGAMAIVGGRNIANEYFMQRAGDNFIDLDTLVVGAVLPSAGDAVRRLLEQPACAADRGHRHDVVVRPPNCASASTRRPAPTATPPPDAARRRGPLSAKGRLSTRSTPAACAGSGRGPRPMPTTPTRSSATRRRRTPAPPRDQQGIRHRLVEHIRAATSEVQVASPYVVPTRRSLDTIALLQPRGVRMTVLTNSLAATDEPMVHSAYRRYREQMLRQGIELYETGAAAPCRWRVRDGVPGRSARAAACQDGGHRPRDLLHRLVQLRPPLGHPQHRTRPDRLQPGAGRTGAALLDALQARGAPIGCGWQPDGRGIEWHGSRPTAASA